MGQTLSSPVAYEFVEWRIAHQTVEQPAALPHRTAHGHLAQDDIEDPRRIHLHARIPVENRGKRPRSLKSNVESLIVKHQGERICGALRPGNRKHTCEA